MITYATEKAAKPIILVGCESGGVDRVTAASLLEPDLFVLLQVKPTVRALAASTSEARLRREALELAGDRPGFDWRIEPVQDLG